MEKYVNDDTIVKNDIYEAFSDSVICPLCKKLMIEQVLCVGCQNVFCKKCIEDRKAKGEGCPNNCENPEFKNVIEKRNNITKFKFKCIKGCGEEILFKNIEKHYSSDCLSDKKKIKALSSKETAAYKSRTGNDVPHLTSISIIYNF